MVPNYVKRNRNFHIDNSPLCKTGKLNPWFCCCCCCCLVWFSVTLWKLWSLVHLSVNKNESNVDNSVVTLVDQHVNTLNPIHCTAIEKNEFENSASKEFGVGFLSFSRRNTTRGNFSIFWIFFSKPMFVLAP